MSQFTAERDWEKYHDPKSLLLALVGEIGELSELLQWLPAEQAKELISQEPLHGRVQAEVCDALLYLIRLADVLSIDLGPAALAKLDEAGVKHAPGEHPDAHRN